MGTSHIPLSVIIAIILGLLLILVTLVSLPSDVAAQELTPTPIAPTPTAPNFLLPENNAPPTLIPDITLPNIGGLGDPPPTPEFTTTPLATPDLPVINLPGTPQPTLSPINTFIGLQYPTPAGVSMEANLTATNAVSDVTNLLLSTQSGISGVVSYTNDLSNTIYAITLATDTLNVDTAPEWYAPALPRPVANVGWRFEGMGQDVRKRYSIAAWGIWMVEVLALPVQFIKGLNFLAALSGPFGLFLAWLLIMFPVVLLFRALEFLKNTAIQIFNFLFELIKFIISFIPGVG